MNWSLSCVLFCLSIMVACTSPTSPQTTPVEMSQELLENRLQQLSQKALTDLTKLPLDSTQIPRSLYEDGRLHAGGSRDWTSGFYPGTLWQLYQFSQNPALKTAAETESSYIEKEKWDTHTHDLGFKVFNSIGQGWRIMGDDAYFPTIHQASQTLIKRFNPTAGTIRSWDFNREVWQHPVIIDNMMNLEMLFETSLVSGDSTFYRIAHQHALTTLQNHFRPDHSSIHVIDYDTLTGAVRNRHTHQGFAHESAWARGQAWGLYGFTMVYRYTHEAPFLDLAQNIAAFISQHPNLPADKIPYWDFDAPNIPNEPRDASAATIMASALLELARYVPEKSAEYIAWADQILLTLQGPEYQTDSPPFFLTNSVGNMPDGSEINVPIVYADYYYVEALLRRLTLEQENLMAQRAQ